MLVRIGTHFPLSWPYGKDELEIFNSTEMQINQHFPNKKKSTDQYNMVWKPI